MAFLYSLAILLAGLLLYLLMLFFNSLLPRCPFIKTPKYYIKGFVNLLLTSIPPIFVITAIVVLVSGPLTDDKINLVDRIVLNSKVAGLNTDFKPYLEKFNSPSVNGIAEIPRPFKVIVISKQKRISGKADSSYSVDPLQYKLPEELRADSPENLTAIVRLLWYDAVVGRYEGGAPAYMQKVDVEIIDKASGITAAMQTFSGSNPPGSIAGSATYGEGSKPWQEAVDYIIQQSK